MKKILVVSILVFVFLSCKSAKPSQKTYPKVAFSKNYQIKIDGKNSNVDVYTGATKKDIRGNIISVLQAIKVQGFNLGDNEIALLETETGTYQKRPPIFAYSAKEPALRYLLQDIPLKFATFDYVMIYLNAFKEEPNTLMSENGKSYSLATSLDSDMWFMFVRDGDFLLDSFKIKYIRTYDVEKLKPIFQKNLEAGYDANSEVRNVYYALEKAVETLLEKPKKQYNVEGTLNIFNQNETFGLVALDYK